MLLRNIYFDVECGRTLFVFLVHAQDEAARARELTSHWGPYRSVGAAYMWRLLDKPSEDRKQRSHTQQVHQQ